MNDEKEKCKNDWINTENNLKRDEENDNIFCNIIPENELKNVHINIINEKMLIEEINKHNYKKRKNVIDEFWHATFLSLENRRILLIQNINLFKNLEELHLDNNLIEELENLDELVNLKTLSISNNNIREIKNLDNLKNLSELNLHDNKIKKIENLHNNKNLKILILSKNYIDNLEDIVYLKPLDKLKFLNLIDNPIMNLKNLSNEVMHNLKSLKYLNNEILYARNLQIEKALADITITEHTQENKNNDLNRKFDDEKNYEACISESYLHDIMFMPSLLFNESKIANVILKIQDYPKIKNEFLADIQNMNTEIIGKILVLNEERKKTSNAFESEIENFISKQMIDCVDEYNKLKKRVKKSIRSILHFLNCDQGIKHMKLKKCPGYYKKRAGINEKNKKLNDTIINKIENLPKNFNLNFDKEIFIGTEDSKESKKPEDISNDTDDAYHILVYDETYKMMKNYIENNIEDNFIFKDKLINNELNNIVSLNNIIEKFKETISKMIKVINENIYTYFRKVEELEQSFNTKILNFFSKAKQNGNNQPDIDFNEDEINEYYIYSGYRSNVLNSTEDSISNNYNKSGNILIEEKKKHIFLKSRERITEIDKIVDMFNNLFYSYLYVLRAN